MKSSFGGRPGNIKCRGKKTMPLNCPCCDVKNLKDEYRDREAIKAIRQFMRHQVEA